MGGIAKKKDAPGGPSVYAIVLTWNAREVTLRCLGSVVRMRGRNLRILLVDNASEDGTADAVEGRFPSVRVIRNEANLGYSGGNNVGIRLALEEGADFVFLLNNDVEVDEACLDELLRVAASRPDGGIFGPKTYRYDRRDVLDFVGGYYNLYEGRTKSIGCGEPDRGQWDEVREFDFMNGHAFLIRSEVIRKIGLLDEDYFGYNEETDWCVRVRRAGYGCLYVPRALAWHMAESAPYGVTRPYLIARNQILLVRKLGGPVEKMVFFSRYFAWRFPRRILSHLKNREWELLRVYLKAVGWHFGLWRINNPLEGHRRGSA